MVTIETASTPLEFSYCSVKSLHLSRINLLQDVARQYGAHGTTGDTGKAIAILDEVRGDQRGRLRQYEKMVIYPKKAKDYHILGRHDIAVDIIEETIRHSRSLLVQWEASIYAYVAEVCANIGERERGDLLLRKVAEYVESVPRFGASIRENYWLYDLFTLYVRLDMVDAAEILAAKMVGEQRADALATLAFLGQPDGQCNESLLATAMERTSEYTKALVASLMIQSGQFSRAVTVLNQITRSTYIQNELLLEMVKYTLQRGDSSGALELLERLLATRNAIAIDSEHLAPICALLQIDHGDMLHRVLEYVSRLVQTSKRRLTRLEGMAKLVGFLAPYSCVNAEAAVDQLLDACLVDLDQRKDNVSDMSLKTVPVALHAVAIDIDKHRLQWTDQRRERFRLILGIIPVPRRFEYADLFRAKVTDVAAAIK